MVKNTHEEEEAAEGIHSLRMGAGLGVLMVAVDTSPMILSASLQAWYIRSISSRFSASSADSSIMEDWTAHNDRQIKIRLTYYHNGPNIYKNTKPSMSAFHKNWPVTVFGGSCLSV